MPLRATFAALLSCLLPAPLCHSQAALQPAPKALASGFAAEPFVVRSIAYVTAMHADGTGTRTQTTSVSIQSEAALKTFGVLSIPFASSSESAEFLYLRVRHADGSTQETPVSDAVEQPAPVTREAPFYSDLKSRELPVRSLRVGDTLEWQTRVTRSHPEVPGQFWGQETLLTGAVVLDEQHELRLPAGLAVTVWTNPRDSSPAVTTVEGSERVYRWQHADRHPTVGPEAEAKKHAEETRLRSPEEAADALHGKLPSIAWTTFPDWASVGAWYRTLSADRTIPDATITAKVAELTQGKTSELEKAQALYTYVSTQIRYVGVSFGIGRFRPHTAAEVLANQYGDCKDKHILLAAMLAAAGLRANPVLIGAGVRFNPAVPSPGAFNHLITALELRDGTVFLDTTPEVSPWRALVATLRDQQALSIPATGAPAVVTTPADLPYPAVATAMVTSTLDPALTSESHFTLTYHDDAELVLRTVFRSTSASDYNTVVQNIMRGLGFGGTTSDADLPHLSDITQPFSLSFHYHRNHEDSWGANRVTIPFITPSVPAFDSQSPPVLPIQLGSPHTETSTVEITLPAGWKADLPDAVHAHTAFARCDVTYRLDHGKLIAERQVTTVEREVPLKDREAYKTWYDQAQVGSVPYLQLTPPKK